jgi:hypothetical protein
MNIPLNQFEQIIDETILRRGLDYFRKGLVEEPEELSPGCFEAMEILGLAARAGLPEELQKWLFEYAVTAFKKRLFGGWDWHLDIIFLATEVMQGKEEADILLKYSNQHHIRNMRRVVFRKWCWHF